MAVLSRLALTASFALSASAAGLGGSWQQSPLTSPSSISSSHGSKPLISTEALQAAISIDALVKRAEKFYKFAQTSEEDYGHPTRVIGSTGEWSASRQRLWHELIAIVRFQATRGLSTTLSTLCSTKAIITTSLPRNSR